MCRFVYYQGPPIYLSSLLTEPDHSLIHQSVHAKMREEPLNGDGFGVGWYQPREAGPEDEADDAPRRDVGRFRSVSPAWSNQNLEELARVVHSPMILAHVRAASRGSIVSETNSHPFRFGSLLFMHNGDIGGFRRIRRPLLEKLGDDTFHRILGTTDSEHFFALFQEALARAEPAQRETERMASAFRKALDTVLELRATHAPDTQIYLNAVVTDGSSTLISRFTTDVPERSQTLFMARGDRFVCTDGVCQIVEDEDAADGRDTVVVSSEPLNPDPDWEEVSPGRLLLIGESGFEGMVPVL